MTTRYVRISGSDSNDGLTPATAWRTFGKLLGASGMASGDVAYVGAGVYRETVTVGMASPTIETKIVGDVDGSKTGDAGEVILSAYTSGDTSAPAAAACLYLNARNNLTLQSLSFVGGNFSPGGCVSADDFLFSTGITLTRCTFLDTMGRTEVYITVKQGTTANWLVDRCLFFGGGFGVDCKPATSSTASYDVGVTVQNCLMVGQSQSSVRQFPLDNAFAFGGGGVLVTGCTMFGIAGAAQALGSQSPTDRPMIVRNCVCVRHGGSVLLAATTGQLVEDYNLVVGNRSNVAAGAHSVAAPNLAPLLDIGQSFLHGFAPRPFLTPLANSPLLGFGDDGTAPSVDLLNRPRPAGGQSVLKAVGALERHDTAQLETVTTDSGNGVALVGPADHDLTIPVDATATTITVKARYDSGHGAGSKPQAILLDAPEIGVTTQTATMAAAVDTWETLTLGPFTPTAVGAVTVRLVSRAASGTGKAFFDTVSVS